jgi:hypothetical protein
MKTSPVLPALAGATLLFAAIVHGQAAGGARGGGGGQAGNGTPGLGAPAINLYSVSSSRGGAFNDLELTALTRMDEMVEKEQSAVTAARAAVLAASLAPAVSAAELKAKSETLGDAELKLALARADAFAKFKATNRMSPEKLQSLVSQMASGTLGGRGPGGIGVGGSHPPTPPGPKGTK